MTDRDPVAEARDNYDEALIWSHYEDGHLRGDPIEQTSARDNLKAAYAALEAAVAHRACQPLVKALTEALTELDNGNENNAAILLRAALTKAQT